MGHQQGDTQMTSRYAVRLETTDGTLEDAAYTVARKADAIRSARQWAKTIACTAVARILVDASTTALGVAFFEVAR
jgi:hypothetical protein